ncbi:MAG: hypothetical protein JNK79_02360, partial [Chitinophagaceae bacterium]|nr:hypothetical protein [Chitinophagaceae bacterium]
MGTMIHLSVGNLEIDWGKNRGFTDHSPIYQPKDATSVPSWYVKDHEKNDDSWTLFAEYNEGYSSPLWKVIERLNLLGYTLRAIQKQYDQDIAEYNFDDESVTPSFEMLKELFTRCDVSMLMDDERKIKRELDKDFIQQLLLLLKDRAKEFEDYLPHIFEGEYERIAPYTLLYLFSFNQTALELPIRWDFDGLVQSGWAPRNEFIKPLDQSNRFLIVTEGSSDASIIKHAFSILRPHVQDFFSYVDMKEGYPFTGTGNVINFVKGLISIGVQNNVIVVFDNDAEGVASYKKCIELNVPLNMRIIKLPDLAAFLQFDTVGPEGDHKSDINGKAAAIECYLDTGETPKVRWTNFNVQQQTYQGALIAKDDHKRVFLS